MKDICGELMLNCVSGGLPGNAPNSGKAFASSAVMAGCDRLLRQSVCKDCYLVDPASSHMLVSKIKPCMSKYKLLIL